MLQPNKDNQEISFAISNLSKYYQYNCDKLLKLISDQDSKRKRSQKSLKDVHKNKSISKANDETTSEALKHRGIEFESEVKGELKNVIDCEGKTSDEVTNYLSNAKVGQVFYQMKFEVPEKFYYEMGIKNIVKLNAFIPDFIEVKEEDDEKILMIYDAKASKSARISHQFQVASYAYLLKFVVEKIRGLYISCIGGIYLPSPELQTLFQLQTFRIDFLIPQIKRFFREELPRIITSKVPWYYNLRCSTCEFVDSCRKDAEGSIAMIPYLSLENAVYLKTFIPKRNQTDIKDGSSISNKNNDYDIDMEDLEDYINNRDIKASDQAVHTKIRQIIKYDDKELNDSPYLKAMKTKQVQFIGVPTANFPQKTDHNLLISMSLDPFLTRPFGWGICLYTSDGKLLQKFRRAVSISKKNLSQKSFISLMDKFVTTLEKCFEYLAKTKSQACVFVYSEQEKNAIQDALLEIISMDENTISSAIQHTATRCLFNLFEDSSLLLASGHADDIITELPDEWREFPRLVILEQAIRENIAIYVPGFYRFIDIWQHLVKPKLNDQELLNSLEEHIEKIDLESIYVTWVSTNSLISQINEAHLFRVDFGSAAIKAYYELLKESTDDISSKLIFTPPIFAFTEIRSFKHHYLGKLYFFKQFEAITECTRLRSGRIKDFIQVEAVYGTRLRFEKFRKVDQEWVMGFNILSSGKDGSVLEPNWLKEFILVEDNQEGVLKAILFSDMKYRDKHFGFPLSVVCIHEVDDRDPQKRIIYLKGNVKENLKENPDVIYRLYKRYVDFNLDKVSMILTEIDERSDDKSVLLDLLKDPNAWGSRSLTVKKIKGSALKLRDSFSMSPSQKEISAELLEKRLQIVWGPPGSGKTHFLALFTAWYLSTVKPKPTSNNENYIIGVTAFTIAAIENLLKRISSVQQQHHKTSDFTIVRLSRDLKKEPSDRLKECKAENLHDEIKEFGDPGKPIVIGGTVWDWYKVRKEWKFDWVGCDMMIIDEGSQLLVSDACLAIECLNPDTGKLIIAGDHMQLGPIIQNTYPVCSPNYPLIFGSIQQCLMRREDGSVFRERDFLKMGQTRNFGPLTKQIEENWRMNKELNSFFQNIYGDDYVSTHPNLKLGFDDPKLLQIKDPLIRRMLLPDPAITLVKLSMDKNIELEDPRISVSDQFLQAEADVVAKITSAYFDSPKKLQETRKPSLFIVTPHHRQRHAIQSRLGKYMKNRDINLKINTVEKMQGQEADLVISCFGFSNLNKFIFDRNRWNVALSRARCKVIIITTDEMLHPKDIEIFANRKISEGCEFISMVEEWVQENDGVINWVIRDNELV